MRLILRFSQSIYLARESHGPQDIKKWPWFGFCARLKMQQLWRINGSRGCPMSHLTIKIFAWSIILKRKFLIPFDSKTLYSLLLLLKPLSVNFWSPSVISGKTSNIITGGVTVGTWEMKLYVQIECQLGYLMIPISNNICGIWYANMRGNMPRWTEMYAIFGPITERD